MKYIPFPLWMIPLLLMPSSAFALAEERFGNAPVAKQADWAPGVVEVVNLKTRVYSYWVNGNECFFYRGDVRALNESLKAFAGVKADVRQVVLVPGPGKQKTFDGKDVDFDWQLNVPSGIYKAVSKRHHAMMTVQVNALKPRPVADPKAVEQALRDLESDVFATWEKAREALQHLGSDAKPFLLESLKAKQSIEARRRVVELLDRLRDFDIGDLVIPKGVSVVAVDEYVAIHLKGLNAADTNINTMAMQDLIVAAPYSDRVVPALASMLSPDKDRHVRHVAAVCLGSAGVVAKGAVPALKEQLKEKDVGLRAIFQSAIQEIEKAKQSPAEETELARRRAIVREINGLRK